MSHDSVARRGRRPGDLRVVVRRAAKLPRTLGAPSLFAACYGNVGSSIYYALGLTAAFALGLTPPALILAGPFLVAHPRTPTGGTASNGVEFEVKGSDDGHSGWDWGHYTGRA